GGYWLRRVVSSPRAPRAKIMIAVLPFENLSDNPKEDYFADGLTEETIAQLGELQPSRLGVIARTSAMRYKHTQESVDQIGRQQSQEGIQKAIEYFQKAIQEDPRDARAQAALSEAYWAGSTYYVAPLDVMPKAKAAALRSLELDDNLADAHASLGNVLLFFDWDWPGSEREFRRALALNPSLPDAHMGYADYLATIGKFDDSIAQVRQAYALDPVSPSVRPEALWIYLFSGRDQDL